MSIEAIKTAIPLEPFIGEHVEKRGRGYLCPFHSDRNPSFSVKGEKWRCWSCGEHGDLIDFTVKYYGLDTKAAIRLLAGRTGLKRDKMTPAERVAVDKAKRERDEKQEFKAIVRAWEKETRDCISEVLRRHRKMIATRTAPFTEAELQNLACLQGEVDYWEYLYDEVLCGKDDRLKYELFKEDMVGYEG